MSVSLCLSVHSNPARNCFVRNLYGDDGPSSPRTDFRVAKERR